MSRVSEHLMRVGAGSLNFEAGVPLAVTNTIRGWVDENAGAGAVGAHVVVTAAPIDADAITAALLYSNALYAGPITDRPDRLSVRFSGMKLWLGTYLDSAVTRSAGTPTQWVGDLVTNGITAGTAAGGGSNVTRTFKAHAVEHGQALDAVAATGGWEYEINPDGTVDYGTIANLFGSTPDIVITAKDEGPDGTYRGVQGSLLDQALTQLGPQLPTKAVALGAGAGDAITKGTDTTSRNLKTRSGGTPTIVAVANTPSDPDADIDTTATNFLNLQGMRRRVNVATRTAGIRRLVRPGKYVYLHDLAAGLFDTSEQITFRGETITPAKVRCTSLSWPIEPTYGVYIIQNAASPEVLDVTRWVAFDEGDAFWTVGDWSPPGYGPANRTQPDVEERIAAGGGAWTAATLQNSWVNFGSGFVDAEYRKTTDGRVHLRGLIKNGSTSTDTTLLTLPSGYRPVNRCIFTTVSAGAFTRVDVRTDGKVSIHTPIGGNSYLSLDGISFSTL